jgi:hypothetical protein
MSSEPDLCYQQEPPLADERPVNTRYSYREFFILVARPTTQTLHAQPTPHALRPRESCIRVFCKSCDYARLQWTKPMLVPGISLVGVYISQYHISWPTTSIFNQLAQSQSKHV